MCRTAGRRCSHGWDNAKREEVNARRRAQYAAKKNGQVRQYSRTENAATSASPAGELSGLTSQQESFFRNTKAVNKDGTLTVVYHGSSVEFDSFDPDTLGKGNDSWGNGFYFTDQKEVAESYAEEAGTDEANVKDFYINLENPLIVDGVENMSLTHIRFSKEEALTMLRNHPDVYLQPDTESDTMNFLGDYAEEYWERDRHTPEQFDEMIRKVADEYFDDAGWVEMENLYGKEHGQAWLRTVHEVTGHDGVIVDFGEKVGKHYVAWFPEQIKLTTNSEPDPNSAKF